MTESQKILVVEDNDFVRMQIVKYLTEAGYDVVEANDGEQALNVMDDGVHLAIVDVRMQPIDGFAFVKTLRARKIEVPVILVTGDRNPDLLDSAGKYGVAAVLMKPVDKDRLVKMVERSLRVKSKSKNS